MASSKVASFPPVYNHAAQHASENLRRALPLLNKHKSPVNPGNYAVWYEDVSGDNQALMHAIDSRLNNNEVITANITQELYEKYVLMDMPERIQQTNNGLKLIVNNALNTIINAGNKADRCASGLTDTQSVLEKCNDLGELKSLVSEILSQTQVLTETSNELKQELAQSSDDMLRLQTDLEAIKKSARVDGLTGLLNRGAFNQEITTLCQQTDTKVTLLLFDLDHFKKLNDTFGHLLGDKVLQYSSAILQKQCGDAHIAARYGGEEMAMLLLGSSEQEALTIATVIMETLANSRLKKKNSDENIGQVTVSIGISAMQPDDTPNMLIDRADQALYLSKANGRNQVNVF